MLPRKYIEKYLFFLLGHRWLVIGVIGGITLYFVYFMIYHMAVFTNFFDLYPPGHPYIQLYTKYREMFGTANTVAIVLEVKDGDIFTKPETIQKVDRITLELLHEIPGVNGEQIFSITHPRIKTSLTAGSGIKVVPLTYPRLPQDREDLEFFKQKVYATEGVRGLFVSPDDKATQIIAGFWEEYFDILGMWAKVQEIESRQNRLEDQNLATTALLKDGKPDQPAPNAQNAQNAQRSQNVLRSRSTSTDNRMILRSGNASLNYYRARVRSVRQMALLASWHCHSSTSPNTPESAEDKS